jgi:hypothetical protein
MVKQFNVWLIVEEIDEAVDDNGNDINSVKIKKCKTEEEANYYIKMILEYKEEIESQMG